MKFFIDTANLSHIKEAAGLGILDGVTTNPSLMAKEGIKGTENILKHYADICAIVEGNKDRFVPTINGLFANKPWDKVVAEIFPVILVVTSTPTNKVLSVFWFSCTI